MYASPKPRAGRAWSRPLRQPRRRPEPPELGFIATEPDSEEAQLARDLGALLDAGLILPVSDGVSTRYAIAEDVSPERV